MKKIYLYLLPLGVCMLLLGGKCNQANMEWIKEVVDTKWIHSFEDDKDGLKAFRPQKYDFPPARGRSGFQINADGTFIDFPISPRDGNDRIEGTWEKASGNRIKVQLNDGTSFDWEYHSLENGVLYGMRR